MVEGVHLRTSRKNVTKHRVYVLKHITRRNADDTEAFTPEQRISGGIAPCLVAKAVCLTVDFDNKPPLKAGEVHCDLVDGKLPAEL